MTKKTKKSKKIKKTKTIKILIGELGFYLLFFTSLSFLLFGFFGSSGEEGGFEFLFILKLFPPILMIISLIWMWVITKLSSKEFNKSINLVLNIFAIVVLLSISSLVTMNLVFLSINDWDWENINKVWTIVNIIAISITLIIFISFLLTYNYGVLQSQFKSNEITKNNKIKKDINVEGDINLN